MNFNFSEIMISFLRRCIFSLQYVAINLNICLYIPTSSKLWCSPPFNVCQKFKRAEAAGQDEKPQ